MNAKRALTRARVPDEMGAEARAWTVVQSAYLQRTPAAASAGGRRIAVVIALIALIGALALSPAGATVGRLITRALGVHHAAPALFSLPASGRLLVSGPGGTWTVAADGSTRRLGPWPQASWSPHGLFVAVAGGDRLLAVDPRGTPRWTLARPSASDPRWFSPTGYRIAYRSGADLRVVAGDGTGDRLVAAGVARVAPAWRPAHRYELAYVTAGGSLVVRDADSARAIWTVTAPAGTRKLVWSADGARLLAVGRPRAVLYDRSGGRIGVVAMPPSNPILDASLSPDGRAIALARGGQAGDVELASFAGSTPRLRRVLSGAGLGGLVFSPDGRWLLVSWPAADQWVFVRVAGKPRIVAFSRIRQQFANHGSGSSFPRIDGWCCTVQGTTG